MAIAIQKMSNLDYFFLAEELQPLVGGYVSKIYELRPNLFRFKVRGEKEYNFIAELGLRAHLSKYIEESPESPTNFTMVLRKHLENAKITEIKQENEDRLLVFTLQKNEEFHLIFEMFAKGNLLLTSADFTIIAPYKNEKSKVRLVKRGETYAALLNNFKLPEKPTKAPCVYYENGVATAYAAFDSEKLSNFEKKGFPTISEAADEYYYQILKAKLDGREKAQEVSPEAERELRKLEITLSQQKKALEKFSEEAEYYLKAGDYVYKNFESVEKLIKRVRDLRKQEKGGREIEADIRASLGQKVAIEKDAIKLEVDQPEEEKKMQ